MVIKDRLLPSGSDLNASKPAVCKTSLTDANLIPVINLRFGQVAESRLAHSLVQNKIFIY